ncbi:DUF2789 family protein [Pseudomonas sp.]|uniref:DUF2789 family protein n=1 Tax=Pseudomonas sp. TaxID=306 RepID=UPI002610BD5C|nr:DUF2789 family protein [Pseudomonas sp.]
MDETATNMNTLFAQLGLKSDDEAIEAFITQHSPLEADLRLEDAPFWKADQAQFLKEHLNADDNWALVIDQLNTRLRPAH